MELIDLLLAAFAEAQSLKLEGSLCEALGLAEGSSAPMIWALHGSTMVVCVLERIKPTFVSPGRIVMPRDVVCN